jgi:hypothetical protein
MQIDGQASSLREDLIAAFEARDAAPSEPAVTPEPGATGEGGDTGTDRSNTPDAGTAPDTASAPKDGKGDEPARASKDKPEGEKPEGEKGDLTPPTVWSKEDKDEFYSLPPKAQEILLKRNRSAEAAVTKKFQEVAERGKQYDEFDEVLKPYRQRIELNGHTPASYIKNVLTVGAYADSDPVEFIKWFAGQRGVNLGALAGGVRQPQQMQPQQQGYQAPQMRVDPVTGQLVQHVGALQSQLKHVTDVIQRDHEAKIARTNAEVIREIEAFANATDEHGNPKNPFLDDVERDMASLIQSGQVKTLEEAYERAVWANPTTRQKLQEDLQSKASREALRKEQEKAKAAQRSSASLRGTGASSPAPDNQGSDNLRETIRQAYARQQSAGVI